MIIVVVIIALLAMLTVFAFNNYRARTAKTEMKNELMQAAGSVKNYRSFNIAYLLIKTLLVRYMTQEVALHLHIGPTAQGQDFV